MTNVLMMSLWKDDAGRYIHERINELLGRDRPGLRWLWVVGDSSDATEDILRAEVERRGLTQRVRVERRDTGLEVWDPESRLRRLSATLDHALDLVGEGEDHLVWVESDLLAPPDLVDRLLAHGKDIIGGWPMLQRPDGTVCFYDTWGYRADGDEKFENDYPYHRVYTYPGPFRVETVGSCFLLPAKEFVGPHAIRTRESMGAVDLCRQLGERGYEVWVDPTLLIVQPTVLWTPWNHYR